MLSRRGSMLIVPLPVGTRIAPDLEKPSLRAGPEMHSSLPSPSAWPVESITPMGKLLFNVLAMIAQFKADLISMRIREGREVAKANGRLRERQP